MSDETGERDDVTVDEQGAIVNTIDVVVQPTDKTRETYEAWQAAERRLRKTM